MINKKIAVFFDCENISSKHTNQIFDELAKIGVITINRAYHNWSGTQSTEWSEKLQEFAIEPIQIFPNITGKNAIDLKIVIDVINTTHQSNIDIIVLVSSDSDFTTLAMDIKTKGIESIGFGGVRTPSSLRKAFRTFFELPILNKNKKAIKLLKDAITNTKDDNGFANMSLIGPYLINKNSSLIPQNFGVERWSDIIKKEIKYFDFDYPNNKSMLLVKIREN